MSGPFLNQKAVRRAVGEAAAVMTLTGKRVVADKSATLLLHGFPSTARAFSLSPSTSLRSEGSRKRNESQALNQRTFVSL